MKCRWANKNVDPASLADGIVQFLQAKGFKTVLVEANEPRSYNVFGKYRTPDGNFMSVTVVVIKPADDLEVEFKGGEEAQAILRWGSLLSYFGGGALLLRGHKKVEFYHGIEDSFWKFIEESVAGR